MVWCSCLELLNCRSFDLFRRHRLFGPNLFGRLVLAQSFEGSLAHHAVAGPPGELDLGDQLRLDPGDILASSRRTFAGEGALVGRKCDELFEETTRIVLIEASPDAPRMDKMITFIHSDQERAQIARASAPAADHYLLPAPA